mgnify:CR=1 FL=1|jgi:hypothetical protein
MSGAAGFLWLIVVILALVWVLNYTGTVRLGVNFDVWLTVLLVLALLGAVFNMFVVPFLGRSRTTRTVSSSQAQEAVAPAPTAEPPPPAGGTTGGVSQRETVQETRDQTTL